MNTALIWLHEDALSATHPVFAAAPAGTRAVFIWDDAYWQAASYSLKRLLFIYETLCELPVDILHGDTTDVLSQLAPTTLYVPAGHSPQLIALIENLSQTQSITQVQAAPFVTLKKPGDFRRFFHYWSRAEKTAFLPNGGEDA